MRPRDTEPRDTNAKTAQLVKLITEIGPDIAEISRRLKQFKESVRYRYKEKLLARGFAIQAMVDHEKLGLQRVVALVDFHRMYRPYAESILTALNELAYVVFFGQTLPEGAYVVQASVPGEFVPEFKDFLSSLEQRGLFRLMKVERFDWFRNVPMKPEFYDFDSGLWDYDWSSAAPPQAVDASYVPSQKAKFDHVDLMLAKELQIDATRSLVEIASKLQIHYKKLAWHYATHVLGKGLVRGYRLNWMGTRYDFRMEKALHRQHRYLLVSFLASGLTLAERMELMSKVHRLPFLWSEACGESKLYAELFLPIDSVNEALQFLQESFSGAKETPWFSIMDQSKALSFTFPYQLFDAQSRSWIFDKGSLLERFDNLIVQIKKTE